MGILHRSVSYIKYLSASKTRYRVHSPYVFDFINYVLRDKKTNPDIKQIQELRRNLKKTADIIRKEDFGSGGKEHNHYNISIAKLARSSSGNNESIRLLYKLTSFCQPANIAELGTSLGISALSMAMGSPESKIYTIEGSEEVAEIARKNIHKAGVRNISVMTGDFSDIIPSILQKVPSFDLVYFDGNHQKDPTLEYFKLFLEKTNDKTIFIFDDIHWSKAMSEAWDIICKDERSRVTLDLYSKGVVLFQKGLTPQHYILRY